jgi:hypothetical protein
MNGWKIVLATLVIFGSGIITGGLLVSYSDRAWHRSPQQLRATREPREAGARREQPPAENRAYRVPPPPMRGPLRKDFLDRLTRDLRLDDTQRGKIEKIIAEGQERTRDIWLQHEPEFRAALSETRARIRNVLTAEQQRRFEELLRQHPRDPKRPATETPRPEVAPESVPPGAP